MYDQVKVYQQWEESFHQAGATMKNAIERLAGLEAENYRLYKLLRKIERFMQADNRYLMTDLKQEVMQVLHRQPEPPSADCDASQLERLQAEIRRLRDIVYEVGVHQCNHNHYLSMSTLDAIIQVMIEEDQKEKANDRTQNDQTGGAANSASLPKLAPGT
jgi:hypothetical protein